MTERPSDHGSGGALDEATRRPVARSRPGASEATRAEPERRRANRRHRVRGVAVAAGLAVIAIATTLVVGDRAATDVDPARPPSPQQVLRAGSLVTGASGVRPVAVSAAGDRVVVQGWRADDGSDCPDGVCPVLVLSADAGQTWSARTLPFPAAEEGWHVEFGNASVGWAHDADRRLLTTEDAGATWLTIDVAVRTVVDLAAAGSDAWGWPPSRATRANARLTSACIRWPAGTATSGRR